MQYTDLCSIFNRQALGAPASEKYILKLILKPLPVTEHVAEASVTTNMNGGVKSKIFQEAFIYSPKLQHWYFQNILALSYDYRYQFCAQEANEPHEC